MSEDILAQVLVRLAAIEAAQSALRNDVMARLDRMETEVMRKIMQYGR